eukprot:7207882-Heterocapsa_arctica.AAC.1
MVGSSDAAWGRPHGDTLGFTGRPVGASEDRPLTFVAWSHAVSTTSAAPRVGEVAAATFTSVPVDALEATLLADCGVIVVSALGAGAERVAGLMRKPADCVASQMLKAMGPGRQYERMKKVLES